MTRALAQREYLGWRRREGASERSSLFRERGAHTLWKGAGRWVGWRGGRSREAWIWRGRRIGGRRGPSRGGGAWSPKGGAAARRGMLRRGQTRLEPTSRARRRPAGWGRKTRKAGCAGIRE